MKNLIRISVSLTLAISLLFAYAGVPVYSMICRMDGHIDYALVKESAECKHEAKTIKKKSCCSETVEEACEKPADDCCDFSTRVFKIQEPFTPSKSLQLNIGLPFADLCYHEIDAIFNEQINRVADHNKAPPDHALASHSLVFISVFRI